MKKIFVSDVTLAKAKENGKKFTFRQKLNIVKQLAVAGLDAVELPLMNDETEDAVVCKTIADSADGIKISINAGATIEQIEKTYNCVKSAEDVTLQIVLPVSTVQMEYIYHLKSNKMLPKIAELVAYAKTLCENVEFVALDATRAEAEFVLECAKVASDNGANAITLCDNAGVFFPEEISKLVKVIKENAEIKVFLEPSDAMSLGQACAVAAINAGADGIKTAIKIPDSISSADFANILRVKGEVLGVESDLDITAIGNTVKNIGREETIEIASETVEAGGIGENATLADITEKIKEFGYDLSAEDNGKVYEEFKRVVAKKQQIGKSELEAIIASSAMQVPSTYHLINYVVNSGNIINATANITLEKDGEQLSGVSIGDGPIDAAFQAIEQIIGHHYELDDFQIQAVTKGREAVGSSIIKLRALGKLYSGNGVSTDIIGACIRAYINALNKIVYEEK